jgi:dCTP deaminase
MSVLSDSSIRTRLMTGSLGVSPIRIDAVQPASVDLTLGSTLLSSPYGVTVDPEEDQTDLWDAVQMRTDGRWWIGGHRLYLGATAEHIRIPDDCLGLLSGVSSLGRMGLLVHVTAGLVDPGFVGNLTLELVLLGQAMYLRPGQRIGQLSLVQLDQTSERPYGHPSRKSKYQRDSGPVPSRYHLDGKQHGV